MIAYIFVNKLLPVLSCQLDGETAVINLLYINL